MTLFLFFDYVRAADGKNKRHTAWQQCGDIFLRDSDAGFLKEFAQHKMPLPLIAAKAKKVIAVDVCELEGTAQHGSRSFPFQLPLFYPDLPVLSRLFAGLYRK